jgi:hypothetical protein
MTARSRRFFWRHIIRDRERPSVDNCNKLMFSPSVFVIVEALPERGKSSLDLACVSVVVCTVNTVHVPGFAVQSAC